MASEKTKASEEQMTYANILNWGMIIGFVILTATFLMYTFGVLPNFVPNEELPRYWGKKVHEFSQDLHAPTGWGWLAIIGKGDYLIIAVVEVLLLVLAASGILSGGGH